MKTSRRNHQPGFTLIELLVVIAIMTLLAGLLAFTIPNILNTAKVAATKATIKKVNELLNKRMHAITREFQDQEDAAAVGSPSYREDFSTPTPYPLELARTLGRKDFMKKHCPQRRSDSIAIFVSIPIDNGTPSDAALRAESAEALYYFLTQGAQFDAAPVDTDSFRSTELADTDSDGYLEIVDAWGNPLRYYRWPTRLIRPATTSATVGTPATNQFAVYPGAPAAVLINSLPAEYRVWQPSTPYQLAQTVAPSVENDRLYRCTTAGTSDAAEPAWTTTINQTVNDDTAVWTAIDNPMHVDPDDPLGLAGATIAEDPSSVISHTPNTWYAPLIVSAGRDGELGLYEPTEDFYGYLAQPRFDASGTAFQMDALFDNLTNKQE